MAPFMFPSASAMASAVLQLEGGVELGLALGRRERPAGPVQRVRPAGLGADAGHAPRCGRCGSSASTGPVGAAAGRGRLRASCTASAPAVAAVTTPRTLATVRAFGMAAERTDGPCVRSIPSHERWTTSTRSTWPCSCCGAASAR